jgi:hypothetical protein
MGDSREPKSSVLIILPLLELIGVSLRQSFNLLMLKMRMELVNPFLEHSQEH